MKKDKPISRQEATFLLCRYYGQFLSVRFDHTPNVRGGWLIDALLISNVETGKVQSFHFTGLRTIDEMTEEEKRTLNGFKYLREDVWSKAQVNEQLIKEKAMEVDYLRAIGIATNNEHLFNYLIKD